MLALVGEGLSNREIARHLRLSHGTVKDHVSSLRAKLGGVNRVQAAVVADGAGLIEERQSQSSPAPAISAAAHRTPRARYGLRSPRNRTASETALCQGENTGSVFVVIYGAWWGEVCRLPHAAAPTHGATTASMGTPSLPCDPSQTGRKVGWAGITSTRSTAPIGCTAARAHPVQHPRV
ncbi:LuxR C-terminal-related transcriptional regulator [Streptomyces sp. ISL-96]|uniref:response regulator transcription factor n=1 Tax=Streptomyces sp. ISL-96 TaxID=2819191 RepID=UPI0027E3373A|nr:LuxR C-terminal-related transcriptional regulator [Streptomyces sp. ISL-96]